MDGAGGFTHDRAGFVHRLADHVHDAAKRGITHRHEDRLTGIGHVLAANQTFGGVHRDAAHRVLTEMLRHFENQAVAEVLRFERVENFREVTVELHVDDGADHLRNTTLRLCHFRSSSNLIR